MICLHCCYKKTIIRNFVQDIWRSKLIRMSNSSSQRSLKYLHIRYQYYQLFIYFNNEITKFEDLEFFIPQFVIYELICVNNGINITAIYSHQYLSNELKVVITVKWNRIVIFCKCIYYYLRFRETIIKISFNMSTICINYQLKTLRENLTRVTNDFLEDFGLFLPQFDL